jgi:hypothetical protein
VLGFGDLDPLLTRTAVNIDFDAHPGFSAYVLLLMFSGIVMVVLASPAVRRSTVPMRILNTVAGLGFFGYGFYLTFLWDGGSYLIFFKAFVLPAVLLFKTIQGARARNSTTVPAATGQPAGTTPGASPAPFPPASSPEGNGDQRSASV